MSERMAELLGERRVAPSILSADFTRLGEQVDEVLAAGARVIHVDVMASADERRVLSSNSDYDEEQRDGNQQH